MGYYRHVVAGGEYVLRGDRFWQLTFNGVQIGGLYRSAEEALAGIARIRAGQVLGPNLAGVPDPPAHLDAWEAAHAPAASSA